ncbi:MAG: trypsin-like serine protease [Campylobacterota bacterium]|nr:trypsin-like serine protease [Campylobacterota bacterium]
MLKNFFIFRNKLFLVLFLLCSLFADKYVELGDEAFSKKYYTQAIKQYKQSLNQNSQEVKFRLAQSYIKLGDNFLNIKEYKIAISWYKKAQKIDKNKSLLKISKVYEMQADQYNRINKYQKALQLYNKALDLNNKDVNIKIKQIKDILNHKSKLTNDSRELVVNKSPVWTKAIGRLIIPTKLEFVTKTRYKTKHKKCSASLVNLSGYTKSKVIVTASHCLTSYDKSAGNIKFIIKDSKNNMIHRVAEISLDSNFKLKKLKTTTDWAILVLNREISANDVQSLIVQKDSFIKLQTQYKNSYGSLGGFSSDIAKYGAKLTYDPKCKLKSYSKMYAASTCTGFNGSSGGPIVLTTSNDNINYTYNFVGVVSHFKNKNFKNIYFTPHNLFYKQLKKTIQSNNR